jgi:large subunit ribosomal protein L10
MQGVLAQAISLISAPLLQAARLFSALQSAAEENPSLIAGRGQPAEDVFEASDTDLAAPVGGEAAADVAPGAPSATGPAPVTEASPTTEAAPAAEENTEAAPAAEENTDAAPAATDTSAADAVDDK